MTKKKWFHKAVESGRTKNLDCWTKSANASYRRKCAVKSRPTNWSNKKKYLSAGRALQALSNVTKDKKTKKVAKTDAKYFFNKLNK